MTHQHVHPPDKKLLNRMSRIVGHTNSIKTMIEENRDCSEILIQIAAVRSALNNVGKLLLEEHIRHCVIDAVKSDPEEEMEIVEELTAAIDKFIR